MFSQTELQVIYAITDKVQVAGEGVDAVAVIRAKIRAVLQAPTETPAEIPTPEAETGVVKVETLEPVAASTEPEAFGD